MLVVVDPIFGFEHESELGFLFMFQLGLMTKSTLVFFTQDVKIAELTAIGDLFILSDTKVFPKSRLCLTMDRHPSFQFFRYVTIRFYRRRLMAFG